MVAILLFAIVFTWPAAKGYEVMRRGCYENNQADLHRSTAGDGLILYVYCMRVSFHTLVSITRLCLGSFFGFYFGGGGFDLLGYFL